MTDSAAPIPSVDRMPLATIFGGSGFVGRYAAQHLARRGWRVRVAVRRPNEALFVKTYGALGQVVPVQANIRDDASCRAAIRGADAVIYSVGVLFSAGKNTFQAVQAEGPDRAARIAAEEGVKRFTLVSAIGADADSPSEYARTKAAGEAAVRARFPDAAILRPSIVFGPEDAFFNRFAAMARLSPAIPVVGADTRFQPVFVGDVGAAIAAAAAGEAEPGATYELGGPEIETFRALIERMLAEIRRKRFVVEMPRRVAMAQGAAMEKLAWIGVAPPITRDQVLLLGADNVAAEGAKGLADLRVAPTAMASVLPSYLYSYLPHGQYDRDAPSAPE